MFPLRLLSFLSVALSLSAAPLSLFDGRTLTGWDGDPKWWRVDNGSLVGGSRTEKVDHNYFVATTRSFENFDLRLKLRLTGDPATGLINSGVQIRSIRVPGSTEMAGYQVDAGDGWWGKLYDESRRRRVIAEPADPAAVEAAVNRGGWNDYRILAEGPRIRSWINGVPALDFTDTEPGIARDGHIGIQIHSGGNALVEVKDIVIEELPPTPGALTWAQVGFPSRPPAAPIDTPKKTSAVPPVSPVPATGTSARDLSYNTVSSGALSPEEERLGFRLPAGFEVELVAAESDGVGKFVGLAWDARMRLWSMTALEYPVDGNEQKAASDALFAAGGRDKVVVFDTPYGAPPPGDAAVAGPPRVFADGLVMPLGVLPYKDGAFVQYGADIRFYRDRNGDGRADGHEVILTGFGTQDSHLFPHQFLRQPGGRVFLAQGLFNYSNVRRPDGRPFADGATEIAFDQCKLAAFALDGSTFESLTAGPNNIWGLHTSREGETFLQEANDLGYAVIPYAFGIYVRTGSRDLLRPYQPLMPPPLGELRMGGTGLSGLALAEDADGLFRQVGVPGDSGTQVFFLANPIANSIQVVRAVPDGDRYRYEKLPDFLTTDDRWFRPVALHFGPDGALYFTDWYNKIISHNEVPRTHPDRDKTRGRIWRIRHRDQPRTVPPDLTRLDDRALLGHLGAPNALVSRLAWLELIDRRAVGVLPDLAAIVGDRTTATDRRLAALWAMEGLTTVPLPLLRVLAAEAAPALRREAARLAAGPSLAPAEAVALLRPLVLDAHLAVRSAAGDALRRRPRADADLMGLAAQLGRERLATGDETEHYWRDYERFLARWTLEANPAATRTLLASPAGRALPVENRALATLALGGREAALGLAALAPDLRRPLYEDEVRVLAGHAAEPAVRTILDRALNSSDDRPGVFRALLTLRTDLDLGSLAEAMTAAARPMLAGGSPAESILAAEVAGAFKLRSLDADLEALLRRTTSAGTVSPAGLAALRALRETGGGSVATLTELVRAAQSPTTRAEALGALAASRDPSAIDRLVELLPMLTPAQRGSALERLAGSIAGARALAAGLRSGAVSKVDLGLSTVDKLHTLLPDDPQIAALWKEREGDGRNALRLDGQPGGFSATQLTLEGPFTVECWASFDAPLDNRDGLLGAPGRLSMNFHRGQLHVWLGPNVGDIVVATRPTTPRAWTHYAVTRDATGVFRLYVNGELDATGATANTEVLAGLDLGRATAAQAATAGWFTEFRVWTTARSAAQIRENFDRAFAGAAPLPAGLAHLFSGSAWGPLQGSARLLPADDLPVLLTEAESAAQGEKFARFRTLANARGNPVAGRELFAALCLTCHQQGGQGGTIAPPLDGLSLIGVEAMLRNILTPSAAMESAYRTFRVLTRDGRVEEGFLVEENADTLLLRQLGAEDRRIPRSQVRSSGYLSRSLMPEGLLESIGESQVSDLFAYLKSLR